MLQGVCPRGEMTPGEEMTHLAELLFLFFFPKCRLASWLLDLCYCLFALNNSSNDI